MAQNGPADLVDLEVDEVARFEVHGPGKARSTKTHFLPKVIRRSVVPILPAECLSALTCPRRRPGTVGVGEDDGEDASDGELDEHLAEFHMRVSEDK